MTFGSPFENIVVAGFQAPTKATLSLPSAAGQGKENVMKGS